MPPKPRISVAARPVIKFDVPASVILRPIHGCLALYTIYAVVADGRRIVSSLLCPAGDEEWAEHGRSKLRFRYGPNHPCEQGTQDGTLVDTGQDYYPASVRNETVAVRVC